jgi:hypothetical protein
VAGDERATSFGDSVEDATQCGRECGGVFLDEPRVGFAERRERAAPSLLVGGPPAVLGG